MYARPTINGQVTTLGVSGKLWRDALIMYDRASRSLWSQILGEAVAGPAEGQKLAELPSQLATWKDWRERHPDTEVLVKPKMRGGGYGSYHSGPGIGVRGSRNPDRRVKGKALVYGMERDGKSAAVVIEYLWEEMPVFNTQAFGERPIVVASQPDQTSAVAWERTVDGRTLTFESAGGAYRAKDGETGSTWDLEQGVATAGELAGRRLAGIEGTAVYWGIWAQYHPETEVLGETGVKKK